MIFASPQNKLHSQPNIQRKKKFDPKPERIEKLNRSKTMHEAYKIPITSNNIEAKWISSRRKIGSWWAWIFEIKVKNNGIKIKKEDIESGLEIKRKSLAIEHTEYRPEELLSRRSRREKELGDLSGRVFWIH